jgi:hypothetical protein
MKKWLLCLFTYNRPDLLTNAVASVDEFFPWGDRLIVDDGSSDARSIQFIQKIQSHGRWQCKVMDRPVGRPYGGYYTNMRYALDFALAQGYDYCFFFEDDEQLLWKKDDYPEYVNHVFDVCPDAVQIQPLFLRRISSYWKSIEYVETARAYRTERGFSTTAIWNLAAVRENPDYRFIANRGDDLPANSAYWLRRGYRVYLQSDPTVAIVPWVQSHSSGSTRVLKNGASNGGRFILAPLTPGQIRYLRERSPLVPAYQEYFTLPVNRQIQLIWHQDGQNLNRFYQLCRMIVDEEDQAGHSPLPVPVLRKWEPCRIPPLQSHLDWPAPPQPAPMWRTVVRKIARYLPKRIIQWRHFSFRDYRGYIELSSRVRREIENLRSSQ